MKRISRYLKPTEPLAPDLTTEEEEVSIKKIGDIISRYDLEIPALFFTQVFRPLCVIGSSVFMCTIAPLLELFEIKSFHYATLFQKRENWDLLIDEIENLREKKEVKVSYQP